MNTRRSAFGFLVAGVFAAAIATVAFAAGPAQHVTSVETVLGKGRIGIFRWEFNSSREETRAEREGRHAAITRRRPCLEAYMRHGNGFDSLAGCVFRKLSPTSEPLLIARREPRALQVGEKVRMTAVGIVLPGAAVAVEATFADGRQEEITLRQLNPRAARKIDRVRFRYATFAVHGDWCPVRLASKNATGEVLWQGSGRSCSLDSPEIFGSGTVVEGESFPHY